MKFNEKCSTTTLSLISVVSDGFSNRQTKQLLRVAKLEGGTFCWKI